MSEPTALGELIEAMVKCNINIWKEASKIKTFDGIPRNMDTATKIQIGQRVRELNASRSKIRWEIDRRLMSDPLNDCKIDYTEKTNND